MVSASFHPYLGGAEKQALELSVALKARGASVAVLTRRLDGLPAADEARGVPVERLWCAGTGLLNAATFMASLFFRLISKRSSYDAIHVHLAGSPALAAAAAGRLLGKRVFVKLGGGKGIGELAVSSRSPSGRLKLRLLSIFAPQFVSVTRDLVEEAARYLGKSVPVHLLPNGVDTRRYKPVSLEEKAVLRARLGWPPGQVFLYTGRLSPEKRLPEFVEAWALSARKAKAVFVAVGDGGERQRILDSAARAGIKDKVVVMPSRPDVETAYAAADVFVLASVSEGLSNALLEAMASGLAVLASRVGGAVEAIEDGRSGFLFKADDEADLRRQADKLLTHPELAAKLGAAAREAAVSRYSMERLASDYEKLYKWGLP
jgi:glycosyltransferase involved in cell wall biosynthesis